MTAGLRRKAAQMMAREFRDSSAPAMRTAEFWAPSTNQIVDMIKNELLYQMDKLAMEHHDTTAIWSGNEEEAVLRAADRIRELLA